MKKLGRDYTYEEIKAAYEKYGTQEKAAFEFGITQRQVCRVLKTEGKPPIRRPKKKIPKEKLCTCCKTNERVGRFLCRACFLHADRYQESLYG